MNNVPMGLTEEEQIAWERDNSAEADMFYEDALKQKLRAMRPADVKVEEKKAALAEARNLINLGMYLEAAHCLRNHGMPFQDALAAVRLMREGKPTYDELAEQNAQMVQAYSQLLAARVADHLCYMMMLAQMYEKLPSQDGEAS